jgi:hypothetical protein
MIESQNFIDEYFEDGVWKEYTNILSVANRRDFHTLYRHVKNKYYEGYYLGWILHRLDGPAYAGYAYSGSYKDENPLIIQWHIFGEELKHLNSYLTPKINLFEYIKKYPQYIEYIELLARYNKWLSEKELELLACIDMFK